MTRSSSATREMARRKVRLTTSDRIGGLTSSSLVPGVILTSDLGALPGSGEPVSPVRIDRAISSKSIPTRAGGVRAGRSALGTRQTLGRRRSGVKCPRLRFGSDRAAGTAPQLGTISILDDHKQRNKTEGSRAACRRTRREWRHGPRSGLGSMEEEIVPTVGLAEPIV